MTVIHRDLEGKSAGTGVMPAHRYISAEYFAEEWRKVWTKVWLVAGRADEIAEPGDYAVEEFGPESILMVRQADGGIRAFYNVCQHRGNRLVQNDEGHLGAFTCPYHSWRFDLDGTLAAVPDAEDFEGGSPCGRLRLVEVACQTFAGFIWINMDPACGSLRDFLGPIWEQWSAYPIERMKRYVAKSISVDCNWKIVQDNFQESYHVQVLHPEAIPFMEVDYRDMVVELMPQGHTLASFPSYLPSRRLVGGEAPLIAPWLASRLELWGLDAGDFAGREFETRAAMQQQMRKLGPARGYDYLDKLADHRLTDFQHYTVFPNFSASITYDGLQYLRIRPHATDPKKCVLDHFWYGFSPPGAVGMILTTDGEVAHDAHVERRKFARGEQSGGWQVDQDLSQAVTQQLGVASKAYTGANLARQEGRLSYYTKVLEAYMAHDA